MERRTGSVRTKPEFRAGIRPIFIIGAPRSGTSIMTWALGRHPNIQTMEETGWIATTAIGGSLSWSLGSSRDRRSHLSNSEYPQAAYLRRLGEFVDQVVRDCFEERCHKFYGDFRASAVLKMQDGFDPNLPLLSTPTDPKQRWVDGTPLNTHFLWAIDQMFPEAVFIHQLRRPSDVATSLESFDRLGASPVELEDGLRSWTHHVQAAALAERAFGAERVFRLRFERIVEEPEALFRDLFGFLGEEYCPDCAATLGMRLNSSEAAARKEANLHAMLEMPEYLQASSLYWQLQDHWPAEAPDAEAREALRLQFLAYCSERSLL